jgi:hypothetical protein
VAPTEAGEVLIQRLRAGALTCWVSSRIGASSALLATETHCPSIIAWQRAALLRGETFEALRQSEGHVGRSLARRDGREFTLLGRDGGGADVMSDSPYPTIATPNKRLPRDK